MGSVQKAFPTKDALLSAAFDRLRETAAPLPPGEPGRPALGAWIVELLLGILPLDERRSAAQRQGEAFEEWASTHPSIAATIKASDDQIRKSLAGLIARAQAEGEVSAPAGPEVSAWAILALAQGIASQLRYTPADEKRTRMLLDTAVAALLGGSHEQGRS